MRPKHTVPLSKNGCRSDLNITVWRKRAGFPVFQMPSPHQSAGPKDLFQVQKSGSERKEHLATTHDSCRQELASAGFCSLKMTLDELTSAVYSNHMATAMPDEMALLLK